MAATSSRDSTAMKTLAFITTLFLPGTFVAVRFLLPLPYLLPNTPTDNLQHQLLQLAILILISSSPLSLFLDLLGVHHPPDPPRSIELASLVGMGEAASGPGCAA